MITYARKPRALALIHVALTAIAAAGGPAPALAADAYPARPVRVVVPYTPGGSNDFVARLVAPRLSSAWKQPVIVDNRPGGGSLLGSELVARAAPDGYTLLVTSGALAVSVNLQRLPFDPVKDLAPVALMAQMPYVLGVSPVLPVKTARDLVAMAKAKPGGLAFGSSGTGTSTHLTAELFKSMARIDMLHVPYKGGGPALTALAGNEVQVLFNVVSGLLPQVRAGRVRGIGVSSHERIPVAPELPTIAESGVPGFYSVSGYTAFAPAGTPTAVISKINAEINSALKDPAVQERFRALGVTALSGEPALLGQFLKSEIARWGKLIREAGIKIQ